MSCRPLHRPAAAWHFFALLAVALYLPAHCRADEPAEKPEFEFVEVPERDTVQFENAEGSDRIPEQFRLEPHEFAARARLARPGKHFRIMGVTFPSPVKTDVAENNTVHAEYFQPAGAGPYPACVVLHILGGDFALAETVAGHLARQGVAALFVKMPYYGPRRGKDSPRRMISEDPRMTVAGMTQAVLDIRRAAAWLAGRDEVDPQRLGITGISLGGIMSALAAAGEPRLKNVAVVLGGGNFADFIWNHPMPRARVFRERWLAAGESEASFRELIAKVDPVTYGGLLKGRRVLMIAAENDEVISPASAKALWESMGREPQMVWLEDAGHYTAMKYLPRELYRLSSFFNAKSVREPDSAGAKK